MFIVMVLGKSMTEGKWIMDGSFDNYGKSLEYVNEELEYSRFAYRIMEVHGKVGEVFTGKFYKGAK